MTNPNNTPSKEEQKEKYSLADYVVETADAAVFLANGKFYRQAILLWINAIEEHGKLIGKLDHTAYFPHNSRIKKASDIKNPFTNGRIDKHCYKIYNSLVASGLDDNSTTKELSKNIWELKKRVSYIDSPSDQVNLEDLEKIFNQLVSKTLQCIDNYTKLASHGRWVKQKALKTSNNVSE